MGKNSKRKREESSSDEDEEEPEEEGYQVEVILRARVADPSLDDPWEYFVKWGGYDSDADTWEPAENLAGCQRLLSSFWEATGFDNKDYAKGDTVKAPSKWIKKERKRFKAEFAQNDEARKERERAYKKKEEKFSAKKAAKKKQKQKESVSVLSRSASNTSLSSAYPLPRPSASTSVSVPLPLKKKQKKIVSESEDSDDDIPLVDFRKKQQKVHKDHRSASASTSTSKAKVPASTNQGTKSASSSRAPSVSQSKKPEGRQSLVRPSVEALSSPTSSPPSRAASLPKSAMPEETQPRIPVEELFSPGPSPEPSSPEITLLSSLNTKKSKPPERNAPLPKSFSRPKVSIDTEMPPPAPVLPSASFTPGLRSLIKPQTSVPPLPSRQRTANNNPGSATSASFPSRPSTKTATASGSKSSTPTIPFTGKPPTPIIPSGSTPTMTSAKPATPTIPLSSTSKTTPTVPPSAIPAHLQRKASSSSSARSVPPPPPPPSSGSGLSTKQRLAQGAMSLAPATKETTRKSLTGLSFKKNSSGSTSTTDAGVGGSGSGNTARPRPSKPPPRPTMDPLFDSPEEEPFNMIESPVEMDMDDPPSLFPQTSTISRRRSQPTLNAQAHDFLKDIMPAQPAVEEQQASSAPPRPMGVKTKMPPPKIPKKWKWTGKLLMDVTSNKANAPRTDHVCDIVLTDLFPSHVEGLRINVAMAAMQSLHLLSFHDLIDMSDFLKTCVRLGPDEPMLQLARLGPNTERDAEPLKILARYMTKRGLVSLVPVNTDNKLVGHLLLFPPVMEILAKTLFRVPSELLDTAKLISVLLPWQSFPEETRRPFGLLPSRSQEPIISRADWKKHMLAGKYQLSLRVLKFPAALHKWMSKPNRPYCIWPPPLEERKATDITVITRDHETEYLMTVLKECGAKRVGFKAEARAVFVHVGALRSISKMPALAERRRQPLGIQFYTYGTHETIHPEYWGMREIYPFGGVVTFTPTALYEDPWGVINQMKIINKHPLWTCYILPSVLGMATKLCSPGEDPLAAFDKGVFIFDLLLKAIDAGEVSVLRAPPLERNATPAADPALDWLREHWVNRPLGPRNMLEACMSAFGAKYSNIPQEEWASVVEAEIAADLDLMQRQPDIMKSYRRYVVIRAEADNHIAEDNDGFEWLPSSKFSFDDDFPVEKVAYA